MLLKIRIKRPHAGILWEHVYSPEAMEEAITLIAVYRKDAPLLRYSLTVEEVR